jgi:tetratricopeptide (TPR) repeat protein
VPSPGSAATTHRNTGPCAEAKALENLGRLDAAQAAYIHELGTQTGVTCATAGLKRLGRGDKLCVHADALAKDGQRQSAHAAYLGVLAADPSSKCASAGVKATASKAMTSVWTTISNVAKDVGYALGAIVLGALLLTAAVLVWLQVQTRIPWLRDRWPAKLIRRPQLTVEALNDAGSSEKLGSSVAGLIRGKVTWRTDRFGLNLVSGQAGVATALSGLGDISSEAKAAVAVINFLTAVLPRRRFQLSGQLQPQGAEGVGISLELSQNGGAEALISFWADSFDLAGQNAADAYQYLAVPAAAWVDIWMTKALDGSALLTADPQSWAFFRGGVDAQRLGDTPRATVLYEQALAADGSNVGALANLGIICRRARRYEDADYYLNRALPAVQMPAVAPKIAREDNPDWYRIKYQFAALFFNWATETEAGHKKTERAQRAADEANQLARTTVNRLLALSGRGRRADGTPRAFREGTLKPFLEGTILPSVLVLVAGNIQPPPPRPADWPGRCIAFEEVATAVTGGAIDPWQLVSYVEQGANRPPETLVNLACFYTRAGDFAAASRRLLTAVRETKRQERKGLVDAVLQDPVLKPLRHKRQGIVAKLYEMLDPVPALDDAEELKQHFDRQERTLNHFTFEGWDVAWYVATSDFDLRAMRDSESLLVKVANYRKLTEENIKATTGAMANFRQDHPGVMNLSAWIVIPADTDAADADLSDAEQRGVRVFKDTDDGFTRVS